MMSNQVAKKYSQALFELGQEQDSLQTLREELNEFWQVMEEHQDLRDLFLHQRILPEDKKDLLERVFGEQLSQQTVNFLYLLIDRRREYFLKSIIKNFNQLVNREKGRIEVEVTSAVELNQELKESLQRTLARQLDYGEIVINDQYDPDIIGGLIVKIGDYVIDGSIKKQLKEIEESIDEIPVSELGVVLDGN